jgi:hypothetical protein
VRTTSTQALGQGLLLPSIMQAPVNYRYLALLAMQGHSCMLLVCGKQRVQHVDQFQGYCILPALMIYHTERSPFRRAQHRLWWGAVPHKS